MVIDSNNSRSKAENINDNPFKRVSVVEDEKNQRSSSSLQSSKNANGTPSVKPLVERNLERQMTVDLFGND
jgi:hypothetical protein